RSTDAPPPDEFISLVRQGLRRSTISKPHILADVGKNYIWQKSPQNPQAIELLYHAAGAAEPAEVANAAMYYGATVVAERTDNLVRMLMEEYWRVNTQDRERIDWGFTQYGDKTDTAARLQKLLDNRDSLSSDTVLAAYHAFERLTGAPPPHAEQFADL